MGLKFIYLWSFRSKRRNMSLFQLQMDRWSWPISHFWALKFRSWVYEYLSCCLIFTVSSFRSRIKPVPNGQDKANSRQHLYVHSWDKKINSASVGVSIAWFPVFASFLYRTSKKICQIIVREQWKCVKWNKDPFGLLFLFLNLLLYLDLKNSPHHCWHN